MRPFRQWVYNSNGGPAGMRTSFTIRGNTDSNNFTVNFFRGSNSNNGDGGGDVGLRTNLGNINLKDKRFFVRALVATVLGLFLLSQVTVFWLLPSLQLSTGYSNSGNTNNNYGHVGVGSERNLFKFFNSGILNTNGPSSVDIIENGGWKQWPWCVNDPDSYNINHVSGAVDKFDDEESYDVKGEDKHNRKDSYRGQQRSLQFSYIVALPNDVSSLLKKFVPIIGPRDELVLIDMSPTSPEKRARIQQQLQEIKVSIEQEFLSNGRGATHASIVFLPNEDSIPYSLPHAFNKASNSARGKYLVFVPLGWCPTTWSRKATVQLLSGSKNFGVVGSVLADKWGRVFMGGVDFRLKGVAEPSAGNVPVIVPITPDCPNAAVVSAVLFPGLTIHKSDFLAVGGFNSRLRSHADIDLCMRVFMQLGKRTAYSTRNKMSILASSEINPDNFRRHAKNPPLLFQKLWNSTAESMIWDSYTVTRPLFYSAPFSTPSGYASEAIIFALGLESLINMKIEDQDEIYHDSEGIEKYGHPEYIEDPLLRLKYRQIDMSKAITVIHSIAPKFRCGEIKSAYCIGRTMFETDRIPPDWVDHCNRLDELWVPTDFNVETFARAGVDRSKIFAVPEGVDVDFFDPYNLPTAAPTYSALVLLSASESIMVSSTDLAASAPLSSNSTSTSTSEYTSDNAVLTNNAMTQSSQQQQTNNKQQRQDDNDYNSSDSNKPKFKFVSVFEWSDRKGGDILVNAYLKAFKPSDNVALYIKSYLRRGTLGDELPPDMEGLEGLKIVVTNIIKRRMGPNARIPEIVLIGEEIDADYLPAFYKSFDCFVLPSRGEGWGRPYTEAMAMEMIVIGTAWSGNTMFMNHNNSFLIDATLVEVERKSYQNPSYLGHMWAQPSEDQLAEIMRFVFLNPEAARDKARQARIDITKFSKQAVAQVLVNHFKRIDAKLTAEGK